MAIHLPLADTLAKLALSNLIILEWSQYHGAVHYYSCRFECRSNYESQTGDTTKKYLQVSLAVLLCSWLAHHMVLNVRLPPSE